MGAGLSSDRVFVVMIVQSQCLDFNLDFNINLRWNYGWSGLPCLLMQMTPLITASVVV